MALCIIMVSSTLRACLVCMLPGSHFRAAYCKVVISQSSCSEACLCSTANALPRMRLPGGIWAVWSALGTKQKPVLPQLRVHNE